MKTKILVSLIAAILSQSLAADIPRTASGKPNLNGNYDTSTLTPHERPTAFGNNLYLSEEEAKSIVDAEKAMQTAGAKTLDPNREAPPEGGDGNYALGAGGVGGYNTFWIDRGDTSIEIDGKFRTSIVYDPKNGRYPKMLPAAQLRLKKRYAGFAKGNPGYAWWLESDEPGPYDGPESNTLSDRCLQGFGSTGGPPMMPTLYNNYKRIIQSENHVMILVEMVHDVRTIRLNSEHISQDIRKWMGDSIGHWEGDTLVVDTTNFTDTPGFGRATRDLHVVERFTRKDDDSVHYQFTVEDPNTWSEPWSGEYPWPLSENPVYEYACHEGNYAMGNILRGARLLEAEAKAKAKN